ncbi:MAG: hypothetical protein ACI82I_001982 [Gammaproteobacteria bacterium]|jgi:hypothetical protein
MVCNPPFLMGSSRRIHAAVLSFISALNGQSPGLRRQCPCWVARYCKSEAIVLPGSAPPQWFQRCIGSADRQVIACIHREGAIRRGRCDCNARISVLLGFSWLDVFEPNAVFYIEGEEEPCCASGGRELCRNSSPFTPQFKTISIWSAVSTAAQTLRPTRPPPRRAALALVCISFGVR